MSTNLTLPSLDPERRYVVRLRAQSKLGVYSDWSEALDLVTPVNDLFKIDEPAEHEHDEYVLVPVGETITATSPGATDDVVPWTVILQWPRAAGGFAVQTVPTSSWKVSVDGYYNWAIRGTAIGAATLRMYADTVDHGTKLLDEVVLASGPFAFVLPTGYLDRDSEVYLVVEGTVA